jgi:hypothetical protein
MLVLLLAKTMLAGLTVAVPAEGSIRGTEIELGELCAITGADAALVARASSLTLGFAPAPGFTRILTRDRIQDELSRAFPGCMVRMTGERLCRAVPEIEELSPSALEAVARLELRRAFEGVAASFQLAEPITSLQIPRGHEGTILRAIVPAGERVSGPLGVSVEILVDGQRYRTAWTSWRVDVWETRPALLGTRVPFLFAALRAYRPGKRARGGDALTQRPGGGS